MELMDEVVANSKEIKTKESKIIKEGYREK